LRACTSALLLVFPCASTEEQTDNIAVAMMPAAMILHLIMSSP
jgi:hypothetical protein